MKEYGPGKCPAGQTKDSIWQVYYVLPDSKLKVDLDTAVGVLEIVFRSCKMRSLILV